MLNLDGKIVFIAGVGDSAPGTPVSLSVEEWDDQLDRNMKTEFLDAST
mgnify:CR=1 FL=1